ncbi:hypothetical protein R6Q57_011691 [Mikania cordata]
MAMEDNESCGSRAVESPKKSRQRRQKLEVYNDVLTRLYDMNHEDTQQPDFEDQLWIHFNRLPPRNETSVNYALDVNVERAEDVITHKRVLQLAEDPANRPAFEIRLVQVHPTPDGNTLDGDKHGLIDERRCSKLHPPPSFGSAQNLEALALKANGNPDNNIANDLNSTPVSSRPMHEITFSTIDRPKLLSQLTSLLSEVGLNIQEAHAFSTADGFSLDVFVVDGWPHEETEQLRNALAKEIMKAKVPYSYLTPLQAAVGVVQQGLRPTIPKQTHPKLTELLECCWQHNPTLRPNFTEILDKLKHLAKEVGNGGDGQKDKSIGGFFSGFKRGHH